MTKTKEVQRLRTAMERVSLWLATAACLEEPMSVRSVHRSIRTLHKALDNRPCGCGHCDPGGEDDR